MPLAMPIYAAVLLSRMNAGIKKLQNWGTRRGEINPLYTESPSVNLGLD